VLNVAIRGTVAHGAVLQLLDAQGMPVEKRYLSAGSINKPIRLNELGYLRPGLYTIRLVSGENVVTKRILKG
ncbi:MAG: T9SS type A sorting domain-containing protein, partial [Flavobacteriales bacterium]|nr:T9SS type A sorting domain-containing protein [Flavobacteriales bacterium]